MKPDIEIQSEEDWGRLRDEKIEVIVDPMIVRSADLLLQGRSGLPDQEDRTEVWKALSQNVDSIEAFFDAFILSERLPLVDYGTTYDSNIGFEPQSLYRRVNETAGEQILTNVHVWGSASAAASGAAREALRNRAAVKDDLAKEVKDELSAYDHRWNPDLGDLGPLSEEQTLLARFQYGLLLFGDFATSAGVGHLIQTKRARLFAAGSLGAKTASYEFDTDLREQLQRVVESEEKRLGVMLNLEACPSFLPYLLSKEPRNTTDFLSEALKLRRLPIISTCREWRGNIVSDWQRFGKIDASTEREVRRAVRGVLQELGIDAQQSYYTVGFNLFFLYAEAAVEKLLGWIPALRKKSRHAKLLMRSMRAEHEHKKVTDALGQLWSGT